ncbi:MAG: hypothetical protein K2X87_32150 [Gemmataceae bacterium]|nr:hypothetical protein [Gemmataceae bacterium]
MSARMLRGWSFWVCVLVGIGALVVTGCRDVPRRDDGPRDSGGCGSCGS